MFKSSCASFLWSWSSRLTNWSESFFPSVPLTAKNCCCGLAFLRDQWPARTTWCTKHTGITKTWFGIQGPSKLGIQILNDFESCSYSHVVSEASFLISTAGRMFRCWMFTCFAGTTFDTVRISRVNIQGVWHLEHQVKCSTGWVFQFLVHQQMSLTRWSTDYRNSKKQRNLFSH